MARWQQLPADIRNFLESRPILARPQTVRYRTVKFVRRHRGALAAGAVILLSLLGGIAYSTYQARRAEARFQQVRKLASLPSCSMCTMRFSHWPVPPRLGSFWFPLAWNTWIALPQKHAATLDRSWELAQAYIKLGNVQGSPRAGPHLGDTAGALASHRKAINLLDQLALSADPVTSRCCVPWSTSSQAAGDLEVYAGNRPQALAAYARAIEIAQRTAAHPQHEPADIRLLGLALVSVGNSTACPGRKRHGGDQARSLLWKISEALPRQPPSQRGSGASPMVYNTLGKPMAVTGISSLRPRPTDKP